MSNTNQGVENNNYFKEKLLGEGAFGKAYLVRYLTDNSLWVMKQMDISSMSPKEKQETIKEAKILEYLEHPNIVKFKDVFYQCKSGKLCIIMEYADGGDIAQKIKDQKGQPIPEQKILDWFTQICLAIKHVHDRKIIHRDLKGLNIFLTKQGNIKLGDFGIARIFQQTLDKAKTQIGTPYYLSPEIIESRPYNFASDIWSLGAILYELCTLKPPFLADNLPNLALKISKGIYPPIQSKLYSNELKQMVDKLLQVNPSKRPTIHQILKFPVIVNRIKQFLTESVKQVEFAHTIIHKQQLKMDLNINNVKRVDEEGIQKPPNLQARSQPQSISEPPVVQKIQSNPPQPQQQQIQQPKQQIQQQPQQFKAVPQQQMKPQIVQQNKPTPILWNKNPQIQQQPQQKSAPNQFQKQTPTPQQTPAQKGQMQRQQSGNKIQRSNSKNKFEEIKRLEQEKEREKLEKQRQLKIQEEAKKKQEQQKRELLKQQQIESQNQQREENKKKREQERQFMREDIQKKKGQKSILVEEVPIVKQVQEHQNLLEYNSDDEQQNDQLNESFENHLKTESTQPNNDYGVQCEEEDKDNLEMAKIIIQIEQLAQDEENNQRESELEEFEQKRKQVLEQEEDIDNENDYGEDFDDDDQLMYSDTENIKGIEEIVKIRNTLEELMGENQVQNASQILTNELKIKSIDDIEKEHGPNSFATLFPFIEKSIRKKAVLLLFQYQKLLQSGK